MYYCAQCGSRFSVDDAEVHLEEAIDHRGYYTQTVACCPKCGAVAVRAPDTQYHVPDGEKYWLPTRNVQEDRQ